VTVADTPFGRLGMLVCADAYTYDTSTLDALKALKPELVIIPWGVAAGSTEECGESGFNATGFAAEAAAHLKSAYVVGANAVGSRPFGRFLPSWYCGTSGYATPDGKVGAVADEEQEMAIFDIPIP
jgi:N-carbamoylputrescine amidase